MAKKEIKMLPLSVNTEANWCVIDSEGNIMERFRNKLTALRTINEMKSKFKGEEFTLEWRKE